MTSSVIHRMSGIEAADTPPIIPPSGLTYVASVALTRAGNFAVPGGFTTTPIQWNTAAHDDGWGFVPTSSDAIVPAGVSYVMIVATMYVPASTGGRDDGALRIRVAGVSQTEEWHDNQFRNFGQTSLLAAVSPGDAISATVSPQFGMNLTGPVTRLSIVGYA